jgi:hypothetical protein
MGWNSRSWSIKKKDEEQKSKAKEGCKTCCAL